ncbi:MAG: hypothetical protein NUV55_13675 [Sulfuricaulis sp.]|uniref:hypothetical protein n=1 Tax=Sulfuricaulis sp. TaxID=2003553 RepID=UPI0025F38305|nr:hypothetical protein [Sulfuricaulis sp.]MCR4348231.1 hypothetical protein [Sulfuricaulis sp.]
MQETVKSSHNMNIHAGRKAVFPCSLTALDLDLRQDTLAIEGIGVGVLRLRARGMARDTRPACLSA